MSVIKVKNELGQFVDIPVIKGEQGPAGTTNYNDLINKPTIPTQTSQLKNNSGFITNTVNNLTNYTKTSDLSSVATSGSYNDLNNKPTMPTFSYNNSTKTLTITG